MQKINRTRDNSEQKKNENKRERKKYPKPPENQSKRGEEIRHVD